MVEVRWKKEKERKRREKTGLRIQEKRGAE